MIKKLDLLLIKSFIGPFIITFFISTFVLMMQFFWLYMDEMIGKGVSVWILIQLLIYMSATLVPLALPLSVLLSSIMTFGNMGERFELVAIKSAGISLLRFMQPLFLFILLISGLAFVFANNVIPVANLKALSLLYDVRNSKPTLNIKPDQFNNDIPNFSIRIGSKDEDGYTIHDVVIYDHKDLVGNNRVVTAKTGKMIPSADKRSLIFRLQDGWQYQEGYSHGAPDKTQIRMHFASWDKVFDLSSLQFTRTKEDMFKNAYQMMNAKQLWEGIDSIKKFDVRASTNIHNYMSPYITWRNRTQADSLIAKKLVSPIRPVRTYDQSFLELIPDSTRKASLQTVSNNIRTFKSLLDVTAVDKKIQDENYQKYSIEFHRKFTLSFACILLFLIGAPLGAIIRKGGLGMPLVTAVVFFIIFHIFNIAGEKLAKAGTIIPWLGMWMSTFLLTPLALWLVRASLNDSQVLSKEAYVRVWRAARNIFIRKNNTVA